MAQGGSPKQSQDRKEEETGPINEQQIGAEFAKAFQELARGEQTAASLESRLDDIESRIDQLLANAEADAHQTSASKLDSDSHEAKGNSTPK